MKIINDTYLNIIKLYFFVFVYKVGAFTFFHTYVTYFDQLFGCCAHPKAS